MNTSLRLCFIVIEFNEIPWARIAVAPAVYGGIRLEWYTTGHKDHEEHAEDQTVALNGDPDMNFFGMGPMEMGVILVIALIIFGPGKLPEIGAQIGNVVRDFRNATGDLTGEFQEAMGEFKGAADEVRQSAAEVQNTTRSLTRLDQQITPASAPANPPPGQARGADGSPRVPSKEDPLADLMG